MKKKMMMMLMFCTVMLIAVGCGNEEDTTILEDDLSTPDEIVNEVVKVDIMASENEILDQEIETDIADSEELGEVVDYNLLNPETETHGTIEENNDGSFVLQPYVSIDGGEASEIGGDVITLLAEDNCIVQVITIQDSVSYWEDMEKADITLGSMVFLEGDFLESGEYSATKIKVTNLIN